MKLRSFLHLKDLELEQARLEAEILRRENALLLKIDPASSSVTYWLYCISNLTN